MIDTDRKFPDEITLKNAVILMACVTKDGDKYYLRLFLKETLYDK